MKSETDRVWLLDSISHLEKAPTLGCFTDRTAGFQSHLKMTVKLEEKTTPSSDQDVLVEADSYTKMLDLTCVIIYSIF